MNVLFVPKDDAFLSFLTVAGYVGFAIAVILVIIAISISWKQHQTSAWDPSSFKQWIISIPVVAALVFAGSFVGVHIAERQQHAYHVSQLSGFLAQNHPSKNFSTKKADLLESKAVMEQNTQVAYRLVWVSAAGDEGYVLVEDELASNK